MRWRREPLVWFLLLSAGVFAVYPLLGGGARPGGNKTIVVSPDRVALLEEGFRKAWQRKPTEAEARLLIEDDVRTEILAREAVAMGLDRDDTVIRRRLQLKVESIADDAARRAPTDEELAAFLAADPKRFREEDRISFRQVSLSRDQRGERLEGDASRLLAELNAGGPAADISEIGDSRMLEPDYENVTESDVARTFGEEFAAAVKALPAGSWRGPISSGYGTHLVLVTERWEGRSPRLDEVRAAVEREWEAAQALSGREAIYGRLRSRYRVRLDLPAEPPPAGDTRSSAAKAAAAKAGD